MSGWGYHKNPHALDKALRVRISNAKEHRLKILGWIEYFHRKAASCGQEATYAQMAIALNHKGLRTFQGRKFTKFNLQSMVLRARKRGEYDPPRS